MKEHMPGTANAASSSTPAIRHTGGDPPSPARDRFNHGSADYRQGFADGYAQADLELYSAYAENMRQGLAAYDATADTNHAKALNRATRTAFAAGIAFGIAVTLTLIYFLG